MHVDFRYVISLTRYAVGERLLRQLFACATRRLCDMDGTSYTTDAVQNEHYRRCDACTGVRTTRRTHYMLLQSANADWERDGVGYCAEQVGSCTLHWV